VTIGPGDATAVSVIIAVTMVTVALWLIAWFAENRALLAGAILATGVDLVILCAAGAGPETPSPS
jgi:uncharacterized membrane protein YkgB